MFDLVVRGGTLIDGSGEPARRADVGVVGGTIAKVGTDLGPGTTEIDATSHLVTPGWVDMHTHYDAQATWDPELTPAGWHGVTTVVMGNCGVGFAPVAPADRAFLIEVVEGVEDIPGAALTEGIEWEWETFGEYLDALDSRSWVCDVATQVPHVALRTYVMGADHADEKASPAQLAEMRRLATEGLRSGALGISSSRTPLHRTIGGDLVPGTHAESAELYELGGALADAGHGVFQVALHRPDVPGDFGWMRELARRSGHRVTFNLSQTDSAPNTWREVLRRLEEANADGLDIRGQVAGRAVGILMSWEGSVHPFLFKPTWQAIRNLPPAERNSRLADPTVRSAMIAETNSPTTDFMEFITGSFDKMYPFTGETDYEPGPERTLAALASDEGPAALAYDLLCEADQRGLLYFPLMNYTDGNLDVLQGLHQHPLTVMGLADGGAHCGAICDGGMPTFMITHWGRDRLRGLLPLEYLVRRQTHDTARHYGLADRELVAPGLRADLNVIDLDRLDVEPATIAFDLPTGAKRYVQAAVGYRATIVNGEIVRLNDEFTGARPGGLIRGPQSARPRPKIVD